MKTTNALSARKNLNPFWKRKEPFHPFVNASPLNLALTYCENQFLKNIMISWSLLWILMIIWKIQYSMKQSSMKALKRRRLKNWKEWINFKILFKIVLKIKKKLKENAKCRDVMEISRFDTKASKSSRIFWL